MSLCFFLLGKFINDIIVNEYLWLKMVKMLNVNILYVFEYNYFINFFGNFYINFKIRFDVFVNWI